MLGINSDKKVQITLKDIPQKVKDKAQAEAKKHKKTLGEYLEETLRKEIFFRLQNKEIQDIESIDEIKAKAKQINSRISRLEKILQNN